MKSVFTVITAAFLVSSCADKSDPGLQKNTVNNTVVDTLKAKAPADVFRLKYSLAAALCELSKVEVKPASSEASLDVPPKVEENELFMNLKKWSETDPSLKPANAKVIKRDDAGIMTVDLTLKVEMVSQSLKRENMIYFMKHSPQVTYEFSSQFEGVGGTGLAGKGFINERMNTVVKVGSLSKGEGATAKTYDYYLDCSIETKILKESKNAEEFQAQWEALDCNKPKDSQKKLAADNCKKD